MYPCEFIVITVMLDQGLCRIYGVVMPLWVNFFFFRWGLQVKRRNGLYTGMFRSICLFYKATESTYEFRCSCSYYLSNSFIIYIWQGFKIHGQYIRMWALICWLISLKTSLLPRMLSIDGNTTPEPYENVMYLIASHKNDAYLSVWNVVFSTKPWTQAN